MDELYKLTKWLKNMKLDYRKQNCTYLAVPGLYIYGTIQMKNAA